MTADLLVTLIDFVEKNAEWSQTESLGVIEVHKILTGLKKEGVKKKYLDFRFNTMRLIKNDWLQYNWQINEDKTPFFIKYSYIWHFTGCSIEERTNLMTSIWQQTKHLYG